ncbi:MAG: hypothetical protein PGN16_10720 [Sphingomonas phyllosphaerae]|uniref:PIN-like domain-containing protein n=1 Tax=Sphingomonas phyllosphaerae TaxID=257003 RepID=UPI002FF4B751
MKLLVDNCMSYRLAEGLAGIFQSQHEIVHIKAKFGTGSLPDAAWIEQLGKEGGWSVLSGDIRIAKKVPSRELFLRSKLVGFFPLTAVLDLPVHRQAARILTLWATMESVTNTVASGCFEVGIKSTLLKQIA